MKSRAHSKEMRPSTKWERNKKYKFRFYSRCHFLKEFTVSEMGLENDYRLFISFLFQAILLVFTENAKWKSVGYIWNVEREYYKMYSIRQSILYFDSSPWPIFLIRTADDVVIVIWIGCHHID